MNSSEFIYNEILYGSPDYFTSPIVVRNHHGQYLVGVNYNRLFIFALKEGIFQNLENIRSSRIPCKVLETERKILSICEAGDKIVVVDSRGRIYSLEVSSNSSEEEGDMFDYSPKEEFAWTLVQKLDVGLPVIGCCSVPGGLILAQPVDEDLNLLFYGTNNFSLVYEKKFANRPAHTCSMFSIPLEEAGNYFDLWLDTRDNLTHVVVITKNSNGILLCGFGPQTFSHLRLIYFSQNDPLLKTIWAKDPFGGSSKALFGLLRSGEIVKISENLSSILVPLENAFDFYIGSDAFFVTNGTLSVALRKNKEREEHIPVILKGIISFCAPPSRNPDIVVATTRHGTALCFDLKTLKVLSPSQVELPDEKTLDDLLNRIQEYEGLCSKSKELDINFKLLSFNNRAPILTKCFSLSTKVAQILGSMCQIAVKLSFLVPGVVFSQSDWVLAISLVFPEGKVTQEFPLPNDLDNESPIVAYFNCPTPRSAFIRISGKLLHKTDKEDDLMVVLPLPQDELDITCFIQPEITIQGEDQSVETLFSRLLFPSTNSKTPFSLVIPLSSRVSLQEILKNSQGLWRASQWNSLGTASRVKAVAVGVPIEMTLRSDSLVITSTSVEICYYVKTALMSLYNFKYKTRILEVGKEILYEGEVLKFEEPADAMEQAFTLYSKWRQALDDCLVKDECNYTKDL